MLLQQKENTPLSSSPQEKTEDVYQRQAYFIQQVTNATPDMIFVLNIQKNKLSFVNAPTARLLGVSEDELYRNGPEIFKERIHNDDLDTRTDFHQNLHTLKDGEVRAIEVRLKTDDGGYRWYKLRDKIFERDDKGQVLQTICIVQDVNEKRHAEEENARLLKQQQKTEAETYKKMISQVLSTLEEDNKRLAEALQEGLGQMLFAAKIQCDQVTHDPDFQASPSLNNYKSEVEQLLTACIKESRRITKELMPLHVEHFGLTESVKELCSTYNSNVLNLSCSVTGFKQPIEQYLQLTVYRIIQELVINIVRHADATIASVKLNRSKESIKLEVDDNGSRLDLQKSGQHGLGLKLIKTKVNLLKGTFELAADPASGTKVSITIPV